MPRPNSPRQPLTPPTPEPSTPLSTSRRHPRPALDAPGQPLDSPRRPHRLRRHLLHLHHPLPPGHRCHGRRETRRPGSVFKLGCDGSVLIDSTADNTAEKDSPPNLSLHGFEIIDQAKQVIENVCPGVVSCADILAMAARDAVAWAGGPSYDVPKGRKDGRRSKIEDTTSLPPPSLESPKLIEMFGQQGFTVQEMVALAGAHTLGVSRCQFFKNRLKGFNSTHDVDPTLNPKFANMLSRVCSSGDNTTVSFDWTSSSFDNIYFYALQMGGGLLTSDQSLFTSSQTQGAVSVYAMSQDRFFSDFAQAIVKLGLLNVKEGDQGEVRLNCHKIN